MNKGYSSQKKAKPSSPKNKHVLKKHTQDASQYFNLQNFPFICFDNSFIYISSQGNVDLPPYSPTLNIQQQTNKIIYKNKIQSMLAQNSSAPKINRLFHSYYENYIKNSYKF
eukprot:TRINITY_DN9037_c0_g2_i1.p7 TRINITY_DN9037_c0_g2~~TRINITY_DN9037_c0_g2_i1.p7  ORF type:complete len:112 (+),score=7.88 TRINITY_DN9037_c0_g2_i1:993-1328(+)